MNLLYRVTIEFRKFTSLTIENMPDGVKDVINNSFHAKCMQLTVATLNSTVEMHLHTMLRG